MEMSRTQKIACRRALGDLRLGDNDDRFACGQIVCRICGHIHYSFLQLEDDDSNFEIDQECDSCGNMSTEWTEKGAIELDRAGAREVVFAILKEGI